MDVPGVVQILGRKSTLETTEPHPEAHRIQVNVSIVGLISFPDLFKVSVLINKQRDSNINSVSSPESDVFGESGKAGMGGNVVVWNVLTLGDSVDKLFLVVDITHPHKGNARNSQGDPFFRLQHCVFVPDLPDYLVQIESRAVRFCWGHLKHKTAILKHQGEIQIRVVFSYVRLGQLQLILLVHL